MKLVNFISDTKLVESFFIFNQAKYDAIQQLAIKYVDIHDRMLSLLRTRYSGYVGMGDYLGNGQGFDPSGISDRSTCLELEGEMDVIGPDIPDGGRQLAARANEIYNQFHSIQNLLGEMRDVRNKALS